MIFNFLINLFTTTAILAVAPPEVTTKYGKVQGSVYTCKDGMQVNVFQGIPFAQSPVGELRFEKPQPPLPWKDTLVTNKYAPGCIPYQSFQVKYHGTASENCLYLNIWTPAKKHPAGLPVAVFIHGGGYVIGAAYSFDSDKFSEIYARQGVVFVTIQYRLAHFGFMSTNSSDLRGNYGMWDQTMALKFVKENIAAFGGDPNQITIWGNSAGSSSVGHHTLSPQSRGLFSQTFQMSGSSFSSFARGTNTLNVTKTIAEYVGCHDLENLKSCLKKVTVHDFYKATHKIGYVDHIAHLPLSPIFDGDYFPKRYELLVADAPKMPSLFGLNMVEGRSFAFSKNALRWMIAINEIESFDEEKLIGTIKKYVIAPYGKEKDSALQDILSFIESRKPSNVTYRFWVEEFVQLVSDFMFNVPVIREAVMKSKIGSTVYAFKLDHYNQPIWPANLPVQGSTHVSELPYTMEMVAHFKYTFADKVVAYDIQQALIGFFKTGTPTPSHISIFKPFGPKFDYYSLKPQAEMLTGLFAESNQFWSQTMRKYAYDFISQENWW